MIGRLRRRRATVDRRLRRRGATVAGRARRSGAIVGASGAPAATAATLHLRTRAAPVSFCVLPKTTRGRREIEQRRRLVEVADVAAEIFVAPLLVVPFPLQIALPVQLHAGIWFCALIGGVAVFRAAASLTAFSPPPGAAPA